MIWQSLFTFLPSILAGFGLAHLLWRDHGSPWVLALKLFIGIGLGLGVASCLYFFRLLLFPGQGGYLFIGLGYLFFVLFALILKRRFSLDYSFHFKRPSWLHVFFTLILLVVLYNALSNSLSLIRKAPHGDYDAQAIWNMRARFIYRSGDMWENAFSPQINRNFHMDYPLLIPMNVVGGWNVLGGEVKRIPSVQSVLFLYGIAGMLFCVLASFRSYLQGVLGVLLVLSSPSLLLVTSFQTADISVAYFFLSTTILLLVSLNRDNPSLVFLAGLTSALSAWTKNEGIPFLVLSVLFTLFMLYKRNRVGQIRFFILGTMLPVTTIVIFKLSVPASLDNDLFVGNYFATILSKISDPLRYVSILTRLMVEIVHVGGWNYSVAIVLFIYGMVMGFGKLSELSRADRSIFLIPILQLAVYFCVYLITPRDLAWHMNFSMSRLLLHIFPMVLLSFFLYVNTPERVLDLFPKGNIELK